MDADLFRFHRTQKSREEKKEEEEEEEEASGSRVGLRKRGRHRVVRWGCTTLMGLGNPAPASLQLFGFHCHNPTARRLDDLPLGLVNGDARQINTTSNNQIK